MVKNIFVKKPIFYFSISLFLLNFPFHFLMVCIPTLCNFASFVFKYHPRDSLRMINFFEIFLHFIYLSPNQNDSSRKQ